MVRYTPQHHTAITREAPMRENWFEAYHWPEDEEDDEEIIVSY